MPESPLSYLLSAHTSPARMAVDTPDIEALRRRKREEEAFLAQDPFRVPPIADPTDVKLADAVAEGGAAMSEDLGADKETASELGQVFSAGLQLHPAVALTTPIVDAASDKDPQSIWMATQSGLNAVNPLAKLQKLNKALTPDITPKAPVTPAPEQLPLPLETPPPHFDPSTAVDFTKMNVDPETGYLYHATNVPNAQDIAETGHVNVFAPDYGTDQDMWPDASTENRSYWTQGGGKTASSFAPEGGQPVLLRTKQTPSFKRESGTGDWYTTEPVTEVEYLTPNGWRRLGAPEKTLSDTLAGAVAEPPPPAAAPAGVDPPTAPQMYHPVSKIKLRQPFAEMTSTTAPGPELLPMKEFSFEDAPMGSIFTPLLGDRTQGGKLLTSVNDLKFENPVELQAGGDFLRRAHNPDDAFWASDKGVITTYADLFRELQKSGDPLYATHVAMGSRSGDYSAQTTKALLEMIKHYPLSEEAKQAIDTGMRTPWGAGKKPIPGYADWPGVDNVTDEYLKGAGSARTKFAQLLDTAKIANLGGPDVGAARKAVTHPELLDAPPLGTGHRITRVGPEAVQQINDPSVPHFDYASQLAAKGSTFEGGVEPIPGVVFWQDWFRQQKPGLDAAKLQRSFQTQPVMQRKTQEWLDNLMAYKMSEQGKKLGLAGAIGAGLITSSEAKELFGYDENES